MENTIILDDLAAELISTRIRQNQEFGKEKNKECKQNIISENRECVHPFVSLVGSLVLCRIIFKAESINSNMITCNAVENIENLFISTTENGSQDGRSLYEVHKYFNTNVANKGTKPLIMLADGHSSRFNLDFMRFCRMEGLSKNKLRRLLNQMQSNVLLLRLLPGQYGKQSLQMMSALEVKNITRKCTKLSQRLVRSKQNFQYPREIQGV